MQGAQFVKSNRYLIFKIVINMNNYDWNKYNYADQMFKFII